MLWAEQYQAGVPVPEQAQRIRRFVQARLARRPPGERGYGDVDHLRADPAAWINRANVGISDAVVYAREGVALSKGNNHRISGRRRLAELLEPLDDGLPGLVVLDGVNGVPGLAAPELRAPAASAAR